ncbi:hypothetical protein R1flu_014223 [Riccia fluitans]|uniref:Uncharacterized protein n=1 Tax=Riccia fluitans TaxID=41844 RepID=A0ABD1YFL9_9MARC
MELPLQKSRCSNEQQDLNAQARAVSAPLCRILRTRPSVCVGTLSSEILPTSWSRTSPNGPSNSDGHQHNGRNLADQATCFSYALASWWAELSFVRGP